MVHNALHPLCSVPSRVISVSRPPPPSFQGLCRPPSPRKRNTDFPCVHSHSHNKNNTGTTQAITTTTACDHRHSSTTSTAFATASTTITITTTRTTSRVMCTPRLSATLSCVQSPMCHQCATHVPPINRSWMIQWSLHPQCSPAPRCYPPTDRLPAGTCPACSMDVDGQSLASRGAAQGGPGMLQFAHSLTIRVHGERLSGLSVQVCGCVAHPWPGVLVCPSCGMQCGEAAHPTTSRCKSPHLSIHGTRIVPPDMGREECQGLHIICLPSPPLRKHRLVQATEWALNRGFLDF